MVQKDVKISYYRKCNREFSLVFKVEGSLCYCHDMEELIQTLDVVHIVDEWKLFIDS